MLVGSLAYRACSAMVLANSTIATLPVKVRALMQKHSAKARKTVT